MSQLWPISAGSPAAAFDALRALAMLALTTSIIGCATPQPPLITAIGTLPTGDDAGFVLTDGAVDEAWLSAAAVTRCLEGKGMQVAAAPRYLAQYAVAVRPESSALLIGRPPEGSAAVNVVSKKGRERIIYKLLVDRISDSQRVYELRIDAEYKQSRSTAASRAAQLCAAVGSKAG